MWMIRIGAIFGALAVIGGAFGGHLLQKTLEPQRLAIYETAIRYLFFHALALVLTGILMMTGGRTPLRWAGGFFVAGCVLFSGSLIVLVLTEIRAAGAITPVGGVALIAGWLALAAGAGRRSRE